MELQGVKPKEGLLWAEGSKNKAVTLATGGLVWQGLCPQGMAGVYQAGYTSSVDQVSPD